MKCESCKFWDKGLCRVDPPRVFTVPTPGMAPNSIKLNMTTYWPQTEPDHWCGRFEPKINVN